MTPAERSFNLHQAFATVDRQDSRAHNTMAWSAAHAKLHTLLSKRTLLPKDSSILMAVSGGQDSLCLARLLVDLQIRWRWSLRLVHCDHRWRDDSADNAAYVCDLAKQWHIPIWVEAAKISLNSEAKAREWRHETFTKVARSHSCSYVVTGHTASDRAETTLYNLIRGSGIDGISSLPWQRSIDSYQPTVTLVRPLLSFSRQETEDFCQQQNISVWEDSSNLDLKFRRNRIRQELLPYLREHFNPQVERSLSQTAEIATADLAYLQAQSANLYAQVITEISSDSDSNSSAKCPKHHRAWEIDAPQLSLAPLALQRRVVRQLLHRSLPQPPNFEQIEALVNLLQAPNGSRTSTYPGELVAQVRKPAIWLGRLS
ncbi:MAG: tRNA lysidine(34) synthetase TilS [Phormidesmis sp.]